MYKKPKSHCPNMELPPVASILVIAPFLGNGIWAPHTFRSYHKVNSEVYDQYLLGRLHFSHCSLCIYSAPCRGIREGALFLANGIWAPYTFRSNSKKFQMSTTNICFVACILVFAPYVYIELPVGSSRRELHFWAMGFGLLTHSGAMKKNFRSLQSIFALLLAIYHLLPIYILSSL